MDHLEKLIVDMKESLEREMRAGFSEVTTRFDTQAARLERHGSLLQTGNRWIGRMNGWAEKVDQALETKDREIADLHIRLDNSNALAPKTEGDSSAPVVEIGLCEEDRTEPRTKDTTCAPETSSATAPSPPPLPCSPSPPSSPPAAIATPPTSP